MFFLTIQRKAKKENLLRAELEDLQGRINIAYQQLGLEESRNRALRIRLNRYEALAALIERLNQDLTTADAVKTLMEQVYILLGGEECLCLVYLSGASAEGISLADALGETANARIIKEKHGDLVDEWMMRHCQPLLVEDLSKDFRFDLQEFRKTSSREIGSIISCCLISQERPIGIVRLDSPKANVFNLEDLRLLSTISDIASVAIDNARYYQRTRELAIKDSLTSLFTRAYTLERLEEELRRSLLIGGTVSLLMIDIDFFKKYNDTYGHLSGDAVLKCLSQWLNGCFKARGGIIGRYGGEEFLVILPSLAKQEAFSLAESFRALAQEKDIPLRRKTTSVTVSIGIANFPADAQEAGALLRMADDTLYKAKKTGRNRVCLF